MDRINLVVGGTIALTIILIGRLRPAVGPLPSGRRRGPDGFGQSPHAQFLVRHRQAGRDVLSRVIFGARISLAVGLIGQVFNTIIGIILGMTAGFFGKWWDDLVDGLTNIMLSIPSLIFALAIMALPGTGLLSTFFMALGFTNWSCTCRITRSQVLSARIPGLCPGGRALGYGRIRIMFTQILPNIIGPILVIATLGVADAILLEALAVFPRASGCSRRPLPGRDALHRPRTALHRALDLHLPGTGHFHHRARPQSLRRRAAGPAGPPHRAHLNPNPDTRETEPEFRDRDTERSSSWI